MKYILPILSATILITIAYWLGLGKYLGLSWYPTATFIGAAIGIILALILLKLNRLKLNLLTIILFIIAAITTYYYARIFIDSADFEPQAGYNWYLGYHITMALLTTSLAILINKIMIWLKSY